MIDRRRRHLEPRKHQNEAEEQAQSIEFLFTSLRDGEHSREPQVQHQLYHPTITPVPGVGKAEAGKFLELAGQPGQSVSELRVQ